MNQSEPLQSEGVQQSLMKEDVVSGILAVKRLTAKAWKEKTASGDLSGVPAVFLHLLNRRGYFVATFEEVAQTLEEIAKMGDGFDLYDLARALAEYDTTLVRCLNLGRQQLFPELGRFAKTCPCGDH